MHEKNLIDDFYISKKNVKSQEFCKTFLLCKNNEENIKPSKKKHTHKKKLFKFNFKITA